MMSSCIIIRSAVSLSAAVLIMTASGAAAQGRSGDTAGAIERSSLPVESKKNLLSKSEAAVKAGIPREDVEAIVTGGLRQGAAPETIAAFLDTAMNVKARDLPVRPVLNRIEQGLSKGVMPEMIGSSVQRLSEKLASADPIVGNLMRDGLKTERPVDREYAVETVARALEKSIPEDEIIRTGAAVRERGGAVPLFDKAVDAMTMLVGSGMPVENASHLVRAAVEKGYSEKDLSRLERNASEGLKKGGRMDDVVRGEGSEMRDRERGEGRRGSKEERARDRGFERGGKRR